MTRSPAVQFALFVTAVVALACCVVPPPLALPFEGAARDPVGSLSAGGFASYAGDYSSIAAGGAPAPPPGSPRRDTTVASAVADLRVGYQAARNIAVAVDIGGGGTFANSVSEAALLLGRAHLRLHPDSDNVAFVLGAGGGGIWSGSNRVLGLFTVDAGVRFGFRTTHLDGYASQTMSTTVPTDGNSKAIFFSVTDLGLIARVVPRFGIGAHVSMILPFNDQGSTQRPLFVPSISLRYVFGGETP